jgi:SAM-dependent methyltransferase
VIERIGGVMGREGPIDTALDVACGTGLSTVPLAAIARRVVGVDSSIDMIARADRHPVVRYVLGAAEALPFRSRVFDLVTVSSALHWFHAELFLAEVRRVARPGTLLVVYDNFFAADAIEDPAFFRWFQESYVREFPSPPRDRRPVEDVIGRNRAFRVEGVESFQNILRFSLESVVDYLLTQTNVIAQVVGGELELAAVAARFHQELARFFEEGRERPFRFAGPLVYARIRSEGNP